MSALVFYTSGHGFGHASRDIEVINAFGQASPASRIVVRTAAPEWLFDLTVAVPHELHHVETDTGVVQHDSLSHDITATLQRAAAFYADFGARVEREAAFLTEVQASAVVGDIPPLAFAAAARAGVPSYAVGNFTWDWIYDGYEETATLAPGVVATIRGAYSHAREAWRLPMHGGFESLPKVVDIPFIARHSHREPEETRRMFGLPLDRRIVLSSFGGYGLGGLPLDRVDCLAEYAVVVTETSARRSAGPNGPPHVVTLQENAIYHAGFRYEDLVRAADVVLTKPGYGIIAECLANDTALVYTSRGEFREYDVLVKKMPRFLRCAFIDRQNLFGGSWRTALDRALSLPEPPTRPATDGAAVVTRRLLEGG